MSRRYINAIAARAESPASRERGGRDGTQGTHRRGSAS